MKGEIEMAHYEVKPEFYNYLFAPFLEPAVRVNPGDTVSLYTDDAFESRITSEDTSPKEAVRNAKFLNPQSGPVYINGAEPGDTLAVHFQSIEFTRDWAVSCVMERSAVKLHYEIPAETVGRRSLYLEDQGWRQDVAQ